MLSRATELVGSVGKNNNERKHRGPPARTRLRYGRTGRVVAPRGSLGGINDDTRLSDSDPDPSSDDDVDAAPPPAAATRVGHARGPRRLAAVSTRAAADQAHDGDERVRVSHVGPRAGN